MKKPAAIIFFILFVVSIIGALTIWFSTTSSTVNQQIYDSEAPDFIRHEVLQTMNPYTGEINSQNRYRNLPSSMVFGNMRDVKLHKNVKYYPNSWQNVNDFFASLAVTKIVYNPLNSSEMYFCTGEGWMNYDASRGAGIWKSTDGGLSWSQLTATTNDTFYYCQDMMVHPKSGHLYVSTRSGGLRRSTDGGKTFNAVLSIQNGSRSERAADLEIDNEGHIWVTFGIFDTDGVYYSESGDPGSWEKRDNGLPANIHRIEIAVSASDPMRLYCIPIDATDRKISGVYRSDNRGISWQEVALPGGDRELARVQGWYDLIIEVDPNNPDVVVCGGLNLFRSRDGGDTWQQLCEGRSRVQSDLQYVHVDQHEVVFVNSDEVYFTNDGGIYRCDSFTADTPFIYPLNDNYNTTQYYTAAIYPAEGDHRILGGTQDNGTYRSTSDGISDFERLSWADGGFCEVNPLNEIVFTTTQFRRIYRFRPDRTDTLNNPALQNNNTLFINPLHLDPANPEYLYQASNTGLWRLPKASSSDSTAWERACAPTGQISAIGLSTTPAHTAFLGLTRNGLVYRLNNAHETGISDRAEFIDREKDLPPGYVSCIAVNELDASDVVLTFSNYGISKVFQCNNALDGNPRWTDCNGNLPDVPVRWAMRHPEKPGACWLATELGVYYTNKLEGAETKWLSSNEGLANLRIGMLRLRKSDNTVIAGSHGRGLYTGYLTEGSNEIVWKERGPRNIGGRTRTIMRDPNDLAGRRFWAGSVSGGLWFINNIDSASVYEWREEKKTAMVFQLYPNPSNGSLLKVLVPEMDVPSLSCEVYAISGQLMHAEEIQSAMLNELQLPGLSSGLYIVRILKGAEVLHTSKLVCE